MRNGMHLPTIKTIKCVNMGCKLHERLPLSYVYNSGFPKFSITKVIIIFAKILYDINI
jgi:hypothetical protein